MDVVKTSFRRIKYFVVSFYHLTIIFNLKSDCNSMTNDRLFYRLYLYFQINCIELKNNRNAFLFSLQYILSKPSLRNLLDFLLGGQNLNADIKKNVNGLKTSHNAYATLSQQEGRFYLLRIFCIRMKLNDIFRGPRRLSLFSASHV